MNRTKIDNKYIAGFFDGEGSAMVLTIRIKEKGGYHFRIRPVIKITQKTKRILMLIKNFFGYGTLMRSHITSGECWIFQINGHEKILKFINQISPYSILKKKQLLLIQEMISLQIKTNQPYEQSQLGKIIDIRDEVHSLNCETRHNIKQKYPKERILKEHVFIDIEKFELLRRLKRNAKN